MNLERHLINFVICSLIEWLRGVSVLRLTRRAWALKLTKTHLKGYFLMALSRAKPGKGRRERKCIKWRTAALQSGDRLHTTAVLVTVFTPAAYRAMTPRQLTRRVVWQT
jgi:hypothetical protein